MAGRTDRKLKKSVRTANIQTEFWTDHLPNASQKLSQLDRCCKVSTHRLLWGPVTTVVSNGVRSLCYKCSLSEIIMADLQFINKTSLFQITMFKKLLAICKPPVYSCHDNMWKYTGWQRNVPVTRWFISSITKYDKSGGLWQKFHYNMADRRLIMASGKIRQNIYYG